MLEQALQAFGCGDLARAEALLIRLWQQQPTSAVAALQGQVLRAAGRWADAIAWFERALEADPGDARPRLAIGQIQRQQVDGEAAQSSFEQVVLQAGLALAFGADQPLRLLELGLAYAELEQPDDAIAALQAALASDPALVEAHQTLASLLRKEGQLGEALRHHEALARLQTDPLVAQVDVAQCQQMAGDPEGALTVLEGLLEQAGPDPGSPVHSCSWPPLPGGAGCSAAARSLTRTGGCSAPAPRPHRAVARLQHPAAPCAWGFSAPSWAPTLWAISWNRSCAITTAPGCSWC